MEFGKILDFFKPTYGQLKNLLVASVSVIVAVYFLGNQVSDFKNKIDNVKDNQEETKTSINDVKTNVKDLKTDLNSFRVETKNQISKLYDDVVELNTQNNMVWNKKLNLLIDYGSKNKDMLKSMLEVEDQQYKLLQQNNAINRLYNDTNKHAIGVRPEPRIANDGTNK